MGLFDDAEKLAGQGGGDGQGGGEDSLVQKVTQEGEQALDQETGGKFDSEISGAGNELDQQVDGKLPNL